MGRERKPSKQMLALLEVLSASAPRWRHGYDLMKETGLLSGTLGYVLSEVGSGTPFSRAVRSAMSRGYTEPDPREDLSGMDVGRKALILARLLGYTGELSRAAVESLVPRWARALSLDEFLKRIPELDKGWERRVRAAASAGTVRPKLTEPEGR